MRKKLIEEGKRIGNNEVIRQSNKTYKIIFLTYMKIIDINGNTYAENCVHTVKVIRKEDKSVSWIKMHDIQEKLGARNMSDLTIKAIKGIYKPNTPTKEQIEKYKRLGKFFFDDLTEIYIHEDLALSIIMDCRTPTAIKFRTELKFNQHDLIMTKEQSVLTKIMRVFECEEILLQHSALSYRIDLYFPRHRLEIQVDEKGHKSRNEYKEVEGENAIKEHLHCKFIRIKTDDNGFNMYVEIGKIYKHINKSSKKSLTDKISKKLSELKFKYVVKKVLPLL